MGMSQDTLIAGKNFRKRDWINIRKNLLSGINPEFWIKAYNIYETRLKTRYFNPINQLIEQGEQQGEGFAITILQCVLLEHFASMHFGKFFEVCDYYYQDEQTLNNNASELHIKPEELKKYSEPNSYWNLSSRDLIIEFLQTVRPFSNYFFDNNYALIFYNKFRSSLIHTSNTHPNCLIKTQKKNNPQIMEYLENDNNDIVFYRNTFHNLLMEYFENIKKQILNRNNSYRHNLVRYLDHITAVRRNWYFAYGSNLSIDRIKDRIGYFHEYKKVTLKHYAMKFNKIGQDGTAKANIEYEKDCEIHGFCYQIDYEQFKYLADKYEKGYIYRDYAVNDEDGNLILAKSFYSIIINNSLPPSSEYLDIIEKVYRENEWEFDY